MYPVIQKILQFFIVFHDKHPYGAVIMTGIAVIIPMLYYLYNRHLARCTFCMDDWGSEEIEKGVRRNRAIKNGKLLDSLDHKIKGKDMVNTVYECFMHGLEVSNDGHCLGRLVDNFTRYEWITYSQVRQDGQLIGRLLRSRGFPRQTCIGIYASNCREWVIAEVGAMFQSMITVPLYETLGLDSLGNSITEVAMPVIFSDSEERFQRILSERERFPAIKMFILLHDNIKDPSFGDKCKAEGIEFLTWSLARFMGADHPEIEDDPPKADDIFVIQYTSGTTGLSKGVILTHRNLVSYIAGGDGCAKVIARHGFRILHEKDTNLLYLPMAHAYGQCSVAWFFYVGGRVGFSSGNINRLVQDAQILKPTYFPLVPRIMNKLYVKVLEETKNGFKGWLFWKCYDRKRILFRKGCYTRNSIYDWLVFGKLQKMLGGRITFMTTGSAPIAPEVLEFWRVVFGALLVECYGQTESTGVATAAVDYRGGNVGFPSLSCLVRLLDIPELGYSVDHNPPQGEICLKGPLCTPGYYKREEQTKELFTPDGWMLTGDIGEFLPDGSLRIIDRRKHIFKLSQGEYIAPEKVESTYAQCPLVAQVFVDGNSLQTFTVAVVVPDEKEAKEWAKQAKLPASATLTELCANKQFQRKVLDAMIAVGKKNRLNSLEQIKSLYLHPELFSVDNGLLTPSMKNKRHELRKRFQAEVDALYKAGLMIVSVSRE